VFEHKIDGITEKKFWCHDVCKKFALKDIFLVQKSFFGLLVLKSSCRNFFRLFACRVDAGLRTKLIPGS